MKASSVVSVHAEPLPVPVLALELLEPVLPVLELLLALEPELLLALEPELPLLELLLALELELPLLELLVAPPAPPTPTVMEVLLAPPAPPALLVLALVVEGAPPASPVEEVPPVLSPPHACNASPQEASPRRMPAERLK